jgi:hypothetical protein
MSEKALILDGAWYDETIQGEDVLVRVDKVDRFVHLSCMTNSDCNLTILFSDFDEIYEMVKKAKRNRE